MLLSGLLGHDDESGRLFIGELTKQMLITRSQTWDQTDKEPPGITYRGVSAAHRQTGTSPQHNSSLLKIKACRSFFGKLVHICVVV